MQFELWSRAYHYPIWHSEAQYCYSWKYVDIKPFQFVKRLENLRNQPRLCPATNCSSLSHLSYTDFGTRSLRHIVGWLENIVSQIFNLNFDLYIWKRQSTVNDFEPNSVWNIPSLLQSWWFIYSSTTFIYKEERILSLGHLLKFPSTIVELIKHWKKMWKESLNLSL